MEKSASSKSLQIDTEEFCAGRTKSPGSTRNILQIRTVHTAFFRPWFLHRHSRKQIHAFK